MKRTDYTLRGFTAAVGLIVVLGCVSLVPPRRVGGVSLRRANILSDLIAFEDPETRAEELDEEEFAFDPVVVSQQIEELPAEERTTHEWIVDSLAQNERPLPQTLPDSVQLLPTLVPIEDFGDPEEGPMAAFYDKLQEGGRTVRIAFLGDSFVEGDILTCDLREKLQQRFGGSGAGFAPMASPLTGFRRSVRTQSHGWSTYNIMQRRSTPEALRDDHFVSGWICRPEAGASVRWTASNVRDRLAEWAEARILFLAHADCTLEVTVNDVHTHIFDVAGSESVQQILVRGAGQNALHFKVVAGHEGFVGYGAVFSGDAPEDKKGKPTGASVVLDNYSIRSNNGQALVWTSPAVDAQARALAGGYDLVVLQYGLNIMERGVLSYPRYEAQLERMIAYARQCFPDAAVLVLGVSDRSVRANGTFAPMDAAPALAAAQRRTAERAGTAYWSLYGAMRALGGMERFVASGWAAKDYTHINFAGGRRLGWSLYDALNDGARSHARFSGPQHRPVLGPGQTLERLLPAAADPSKF